MKKKPLTFKINYWVVVVITIPVQLIIIVIIEILMTLYCYL